MPSAADMNVTAPTVCVKNVSFVFILLFKKKKLSENSFFQNFLSILK